MSVELWLTDGGRAGMSTGETARRMEDQGWDGYTVGDSHPFAPDPYACLGAAAHATTRLKLGTWVTNPVTRHAAVTAASIGAIQSESGGRAYLGIGRGDSPLAHLGYGPASPRDLEDYVVDVQAYLRGEDVQHHASQHGGKARSLESSGVLAETGRPSENRLRWIADAGPKVPVDVAASGPKVIELAARTADRITLAVGADLDRITWAMDVARRAMATAQRPANAVGFGVAVRVVVAPTQTEGRALVAGGAASYIRFSAMHGRVQGPISEENRSAVEAMQRAYRMDDHVLEDAQHGASLTDGLIDSFAIAGPVEHCIERLLAIHDLGVTKLQLMHAAFRKTTSQSEAQRLLVDEVLPALR